MKKIGLVGGLTWVSTIEYYRLLNQKVNERKGGSEAAEIILYSVNFGTIRRLTEAGDWDQIAAIISDAALRLQEAGADCVLLGANTMHKIAGEVAAKLHIPLIHIARATAAVMQQQGYKKVALLGTRYTMQLPFYRDTLNEYGIETLIPGAEDVEYINKSIYEELSRNCFLPDTRKNYQRIINELKAAGAEAVILGCTEIPLLITAADSSLPVLDTTQIHAEAAVNFALSGSSDFT